MRIVTTYNPKHWDAYVARNLESMAAVCEVVCYTEEDEMPSMDGVVFRDLWAVPGAADVILEADKFPPACGWFDGAYDYNHDVFKFCRKVFAVADAAEEYTDLLVWLDSDVEITNPEIDWEAVIGDAPLAIYQRENYHSELGVIVFRWEKCRAIIEEWRALYTSRGIYRLKGWHDCWAMDHILSKSNVKPRNLTRNVGLEVVSKSVLGPYLRHDKGPGKLALCGH